jgi:polyribonucleotide nucleotidyltransferase
MGTIHRYTTRIGNDEIIVETGRFAEQAGGAVTVQLGQTLVFATATMSKSVREGIDFFPLSVDYEEKLYAAGRIPGSYFRREGRPTEQAILISRVIDRTLRPLFPENMRNEVQVILTAFSHDQEHQVDMLGIIAASTAIMISDIPWNGPVGAARIGMVNGELVINPTIPEMENSALDLRVSGTAEAVNMVECAADEVDEETMLRALRLAHESFQPAIELQNRIRAEVGKEKSEYIAAQADETLMNEVFGKSRARVREILSQTTDKQTRNEALDAIRSELVEEYTERNKGITDPEQLVNLNRVKSAFEEVLYQEVRRRILEDGVRPDGRDYTTIRTLSASRRGSARAWFRSVQARADTGDDHRHARHAARRAGNRDSQPGRKQALPASLQLPALQHGRNLAAARTKTARDRSRRAGGSGAAGDDPGRGRIPVHDSPRERGLKLQRQHVDGKRLRQHAGAARCWRADQASGCWHRHGLD